MAFKWYQLASKRTTVASQKRAASHSLQFQLFVINFMFFFSFSLKMSFLQSRKLQPLQWWITCSRVSHWCVCLVHVAPSSYRLLKVCTNLYKSHKQARERSSRSVNHRALGVFVVLHLFFTGYASYTCFMTCLPKATFCVTKTRYFVPLIWQQLMKSCIRHREAF